MTHVLHRSLRIDPELAASGEGLMLTLADGRRVIDAAGGAAVACLGHGNPRVIAAITAQAKKLDYVHTMFVTSDPAEQLAEEILGHEPGRPDPCLLHLFRLGGNGIRVEDGAAISCRTRRTGAGALHLPPAELPRQQFRDDGGEWPQGETGTLRGDLADRVQPRLPPASPTTTRAKARATPPMPRAWPPNWKQSSSASAPVA